MTKAKQKIEINGVSYGTAAIGIKDSTYKELPANMKQGSKLTTLAHLRNYIQNGIFQGEFTIGNKCGYLFKCQDENILVDKNVRMILAGCKDKVDNPIHICKSKINKSEIEPLKPIEEKESTIFKNENIIQIDDLIFDLSKIELTDHFLKRCKERFYISNENYARKFMTDVMFNGKYVGVIKDVDLEREAHCFSKRGIAVFISLDLENAITTYEENRVFSKPKELVKSILQKRINKLKREECKINKRNKLSTLEINKQIADYELLKYRAKSQSKKMAYEAYINGLVELKQQYDVEYMEKAKELNDYTKSMIAFT